MSKSRERIFYSDLDNLLAPDGWYEAKIQNKLQEGYEVIRNDKDLGWDLIPPKK